MALVRWKDLCLDATRPSVVGPFWAGLLGLLAEQRDGTDMVLHGDRPESTIWVNAVPEPKAVKNRVHVDLVLATYGPLIGAGAATLEDHVVGERSWTVLVDPEGNEFCVFREGAGALTALVVDALDAVAQARWWSDVLDAEVLAAPDGAPRWLGNVPGFPYDVWKFVGVPDPKTVKNRWHWDVVCDDVPALVARGATVLREPDDEVHWHVLADPEGNEFCVFAP